MPIVIAILVILLVIFTWPFWVGLIMIGWGPLLAALIAVPLVLLWMLFINPLIEQYVKPPLDRAWAQMWRSAGRFVSRASRFEK